MVSFVEIISLALVDAINPCALAVMVMVLMSLLLNNPSDKRKALYGGLAFTLAVFILYFIYGLVIVQFFSHAIPATGKISYYVFRGFGLLAIILGVLNIKDFLNYKPGSIATEMPLSFRPKMRNFVKKITSVKGAFIVGIIVTLFLLPCTMGPYIVASGDLSVLSFLQSIPWLLLYNLIFILPMIAITFIIYLGLASTEQVSEWKDRKIKKIHLIAGIILILLGIAMFTGFI